MPRVAMIGLDGATFALILPWVRQGLLPNISRLMEHGSWGTLRSTFPPLTPPAWTTSVTGVGPAKHGIFDFKVPFAFRTRSGMKYEAEPATSIQRRAKGLWEYFNDGDLTAGVIGLPMTYPPEPIRGYMVSGPPTMGSGPFAWPGDLEEEVLRNFPELPRSLDWDRIEARGRGELIAQLHRALETHFEVTQYLLKRYPTHLFITVFYYLDVMLHKLWRFCDPSHPDHEPGNPWSRSLLEYHEALDLKVGELLACLPAGTELILCSDHGHGPIKTEVYLNNFLIRRGYMVTDHRRSSGGKLTAYRMKRLLRRWRLDRCARYIPRRLKHLLPETPQSATLREVRWGKTKAYLFQATAQAINLNRRGREPEGIVEVHEVEPLLSALTSELKELRDPSTGTRVIEDVKRADDVFPGHGGKAPDLLIIPAEGYALQDGIGPEAVVPLRVVRKDIKSDRSSYHRPNGVIICSGPSFAQNVQIEAGIEDIAPTVLHVVGLPVPVDMDGKVLTQALASSVTKSMDRRPISIHRPPPAPSLGEGDDAEIEERLRSLGYLR